ncbi:MAG: TetR family transcriptional regulator [Pseudomonadota bacterium]
MTSEEKLETKEKIISVAGELFSRFGFDGTSIRDIASQSGVNVASINYHFGSKGNLYWATIEEMHDWLDEGIKEICEQADDIAQVVLRSYEFVIQDPAAIRTTMKMMLTYGVPEPEGDLAVKMEQHIGPPGAEYMLRVLKKEVPASVSDEALNWGMKSLFGAFIHWAMMSASCKVEAMKKTMPELEGDGIHKILEHHSHAIVEYLKKHPDISIKD